ncbi:MAG: ribose-phosphate diphosphokinase [Candidatus Hodgkinia cicadicola]
MKLYTTTHYALAQSIRGYLNIRNSEIQLTKFTDGEVLLTLPEACSQQTVVLIQALAAPASDAIVYTAFALEALKRAAANVVLIITYLGYARQDRLTHARSLVSCHVVCKLLCFSAPTKLYLLEPHTPHVVSYFAMPTFSFGLTAILCEHVSRLFKSLKLVVIALDCGAVSRATKVSKVLGVEMITGYKHRRGNSVGVTFQRDLRFAGQTGIIIDDIIDTGKSVAAAIKSLISTLLLKSVLVYCIHGVLSKGQPALAKLYISNSIPNKQYSLDTAYIISRLIKQHLLNKPHDELLL